MSHENVEIVRRAYEHRCRAGSHSNPVYVGGWSGGSTAVRAARTARSRERWRPPRRRPATSGTARASVERELVTHGG
jgi:hypothetical protein